MSKFRYMDNRRFFHEFKDRTGIGCGLKKGEIIVFPKKWRLFGVKGGGYEFN